jgi:hypothetical protein
LEEDSKNNEYSFVGDYVIDSVDMTPGNHTSADLTFMTFKNSTPDFNLTSTANFISVDGWLGLMSAKISENTTDNTKNFMDQLVDNGVIPKENKTFAMYIAEDSDAAFSSVSFGGFDEEGFKNPEETTTMTADSNYAVSIK